MHCQFIEFFCSLYTTAWMVLSIFLLRLFLIVIQTLLWASLLRFFSNISKYYCWIPFKCRPQLLKEQKAWLALYACAFERPWDEHLRAQAVYDWPGTCAFGFYKQCACGLSPSNAHPADKNIHFIESALYLPSPAWKKQTISPWHQGDLLSSICWVY